MSDMKWYVVHTYSGMEKSAESALRERIAREGLQDCFEEILVPTEDISEVKNGKKRVSTRRMYSGVLGTKLLWLHDSCFCRFVQVSFLDFPAERQ